MSTRRPIERALTRRTFLTSALAAAAAALAAPRTSGQSQPSITARFIRTVPLSRPGAVALGRLFGRGLDARLSTDLSQLRPGSMLTPSEQFYVRTAMPAAARTIAPWTISVGGLVTAPATLPLTALMPLARPMGVCLLECSGNGDPDNFGLMSAAAWHGVPLLEALERVPRSAKATHLLVAGIDDPVSPSHTSLPGASWIFPADALDAAFLAVGMNGAALPADHGAPVRLVVPGWYGCACIKWVNRIEWLDENAPATPHMLEFAARTHQRSGVTNVRDFRAARIEHAAIPIRVEEWRDGGGAFYAVTGIIWGGDKPVNRLAIRFGSGEPFVAVEHCPMPASTLTWSLWTHTWRPQAPGRYEIALRITDPSVPTRRLDTQFYRRVIQIAEA